MYKWIVDWKCQLFSTIDNTQLTFHQSTWFAKVMSIVEQSWDTAMLHSLGYKSLVYTTIYNMIWALDYKAP